MSTSKNISVLSTSIKGALHKAKNLPCQDYHNFRVLGNKFVAVVSDGAGSAKYSKVGAKIICDTICDILVRANNKNVRLSVINAIEIARQKLILNRFNKSKSDKELINFSATIIGAFVYKGQGVFFHIGDGAGIAFQKGNYNNFIISEPENGAFSCETFFYTMDNWQEYLRFTSFKNLNRVILMTDGVTGFTFSDDEFAIHKKFLLPVIEYLENENRKTYAIRALSNTLNNKKAQRINSDDKTLLWAKL